MRKSHRQKVADRRKKRQRRGRPIFHDIVLSEEQSAHLLDQARMMDEVIQSFAVRGGGDVITVPVPVKQMVAELDARIEVIGVDPGKAGQDFISALFSAVKADLPAMILSSTESMKPCLLERVLDCRERDWRRRHKIDASLPSDKRPMTTAEMDSLMFFGFPEDTNPSAEPAEKGE